MWNWILSASGITDLAVYDLPVNEIRFGLRKRLNLTFSPVLHMLSGHHTGPHDKPPMVAALR